MLTREQKLKLLSEAEMAYHRLATGVMVKVFVDQNGERVEYASGSLGQLQKYIALLKLELGIGGGLGPLNVYM